MQAISTKSRGKYSEILFRQSLLKFRQSLQAVPRNQRTLRNVADVFNFIEKNRLAKLFYLTAIEASGNDAISLYKYAYFLDTVLNDDSAKDYYLESIKHKMTTGSVLALAKFLLDRQQTEEAEKLLQEACKKFPQSGPVHHYIANYYHFIKVNHDLAKSHYEKAISADPLNTNFLTDYVQLLKDTNDAQYKENEEQLNILRQRTHSPVMSSFRVTGLRASKKNPTNTEPK